MSWVKFLIGAQWARLGSNRYTVLRQFFAMGEGAFRIYAVLSTPSRQPMPVRPEARRMFAARMQA